MTIRRFEASRRLMLIPVIRLCGGWVLVQGSVPRHVGIYSPNNEEKRYDDAINQHLHDALQRLLTSSARCSFRRHRDSVFTVSPTDTGKYTEEYLSVYSFLANQIYIRAFLAYTKQNLLYTHFDIILCMNSTLVSLTSDRKEYSVCSP